MAPVGQYAVYPSLRGKIVCITGGAEGIGAAATNLFTNQGSRVLILDIAQDSAQSLISSLRTATHVPVFHRCDVTDLEELRSVADAILSRHGKVDILINNAAASAGKARMQTLDVDPEAWDFGVNVNLRHQFFLSQYFIPSMQKAGGGCIVNMGSITWRIPSVGTPVYAALKSAVVGLTRTLAKEFGKDNIRVNSVMPGSIATERQIKEVLTDEYKALTLEAQALKRVLLPDEVARLILFLASDDASAITGSSYCVDGGWVSDP